MDGGQNGDVMGERAWRRRTARHRSNDITREGDDVTLPLHHHDVTAAVHGGLEG